MSQHFSWKHNSCPVKAVGCFDRNWQLWHFIVLQSQLHEKNGQISGGWGFCVLSVQPQLTSEWVSAASLTAAHKSMWQLTGALLHVKAMGHYVEGNDEPCWWNLTPCRDIWYLMLRWCLVRFFCFYLLVCFVFSSLDGYHITHSVKGCVALCEDNVMWVVLSGKEIK